jgi:hypothetical protein
VTSSSRDLAHGSVPVGPLKELISKFKTISKRVVIMTSGTVFTKRTPNLTFADMITACEGAAADHPVYTDNIHTYKFGIDNIFQHPNDMLPDMEGVYADKNGPSVRFSEDILIGSSGSYTSVHIDATPCFGSRITVLQGEKKVVMWPYNPDKKLPVEWMHVLCDPSEIEKGQMTREDFNRIVEYAKGEGGSVFTLKEGTY